MTTLISFLLALFGCAALAAAQSMPDNHKDLSFHMVRLRPGYSKLKLSYTWTAEGQKGPYELCFDCDIVDHIRKSDADGGFIEDQGTGEERPLTRAELDEMLRLAEKGCGELFEAQRAALG